MKKAILILAALVTVHANARSIQLKPMKAAANKFYFQPGTALAEKKVTGGVIAIDRMNNVLTLSLQPAFNCPPGVMCIQVMPAPITFQAQIADVKTGGCQEIVYTSEPQMAPGGDYTYQLTVTDNRNNFCETFAAVPETVAVLEVEGFVPERHVIYAGSLK